MRKFVDLRVHTLFVFLISKKLRSGKYENINIGIRNTVQFTKSLTILLHTRHCIIIFPNIFLRDIWENSIFENSLFYVWRKIPIQQNKVRQNTKSMSVAKKLQPAAARFGGIVDGRNPALRQARWVLSAPKKNIENIIWNAVGDCEAVLSI